MAPKAGPNSGLSRREYGRNASCGPNAFTDMLSRADVALDGVFILGSLILMVVYPVLITIRGRNLGVALPFYTYAIGLLLWMLSYAMDLAATILEQCNRNQLDDYGDSYLSNDAITIQNLIVAETWLYTASICLLIGTAIIPASKELYRVCNPSRICLPHWAGWALFPPMVLLWVAATILTTLINLDLFGFYILDTINGIFAARLMLAAVVVGVAAGGMVAAWSQGRRTGRVSATTAIWIAVFGGALIVDFVCNFGVVVATIAVADESVYASAPLPPDNYFAFTTVLNFLEWVAWASLLGMGNSIAAADQYFPPSDNVY